MPCSLNNIASPQNTTLEKRYGQETLAPVQNNKKNEWLIAKSKSTLLWWLFTFEDTTVTFPKATRNSSVLLNISYLIEWTFYVAPEEWYTKWPQPLFSLLQVHQCFCRKLCVRYEAVSGCHGKESTGICAKLKQQQQQQQQQQHQQQIIETIE